MTLPAELLDYILSFLQSDPATLKTCSETHPSLCQLAEPYIYSHIPLTTDDESADLIDTLSKRPYIVNYIRSLEIDVGGGHGTETQRRLEEIATILPNLLALREITFDHSPSSAFVWAGQLPLAWLDCCLRLQSMRDVCITHVGFDRAWWQHPNPSPRANDVDWDSPVPSLRVRLCVERFLQDLVPWFATCRSQLRSLEFFAFDYRIYDSLPELLASSSNSLTNLDLNLGLARTFYYDFNISRITHDATPTIPITLSTLPHLEQLTIRAILRYIATPRTTGFYSPIPAIQGLFSSNTPSLKHLILDFDFTIINPSVVQTEFLPWNSFSEVICTPLIHLLSTIFKCSGSPSAAVSIQVDLRLGVPLTSYLSATPGPKPRTIPAYIIYSLLSKSKELMQFVERGRLVITPPVPTSFDINTSDYW